LLRKNIADEEMVPLRFGNDSMTVIINFDEFKLFNNRFLMDGRRI